MEYCQDLVNVDEEDLLEELPDKIAHKNDNCKSSLSEANKDDSGLGISDSLDTLRENVEHQFMSEINCEGIDETDLDNTILPELVPLPAKSLSISSSENKNGESKNENKSHNENLPELQLLPETHNSTPSESSGGFEIQNSSRRSSTSSFIDSLLDKLRRNNSDSSGSEFSSPKKKEAERKNSEEDLLVEINIPVSYEKSSNPNMLPTPIVKNQSISSVFVNSAKEYEEAVERNKRKSTQKCEDKAKMTSKSLPPKMTPPKNIQHPRTLAQKRILIANNLNFLIIEQEAKIFKQIQRKMNEKELNYNLISSFSEDEIPIKHGPWRALSWLRTVEGNYIQQYISIDDNIYKLSGSPGNHQEKFLASQSSRPFPKFQKTSLRSVRCCEGGKVKKRIIDNLVNVESIRRFVLDESLNPFKKLEISLHNQLSFIKPRPLAKKIEYLNENRKLTENDEDSVFLGDFMKFKMPNIKLEVKPKLKIPLDPKSKQYLNEIIPYRDMNENWINFSLSALGTKEEEEETKESFEFDIPYADGKDHILAREILKKSGVTDIMFKPPKISAVKIFDKDIKWTFDKNCDKNDELEMEIVGIIKDLTNSVCLNLNDDLFTRIDTITRTPAIVAPIHISKQAIDSIASTSKNTKPDQSRKMLLELRRLNANVVKSDVSRVDDEEDIRKHALAHLAKDERELRPTVIVTDSDTVLLSNKNTETRRQKRAPKRYSDYTQHTENLEHENEATSAKKTKTKELPDEPYKTKVQFNDTGMTHEEMKKMKEEIKKWIHVNVEVRKLEHLENIQPWCMLHNLYKCSCRKIPSHEKLKLSSDIDENGFVVPKETNNEGTLLEEESMQEDSQANEIPPEDKLEDEPMQVDDENSRRVLPIEQDKPRKSVCEVQDNMDLEDENKENAPKMEILNISELINGGIGPIYISIYDTKFNRLNPIFRSILNNKSALVYVDGLGYYLDMKKIDVMRLKFDNIRQELEHPVFIIRPKIIQTSEAEMIYGNFENILFKDDTEMLIQIKDKTLLKEVAKIIEIILQSVRRKIEAQIGCEPNNFVKEQLSLITRDRSNSNSSTSSTDTSPLTFNGKTLERAPSPGFDSDMMKEFNQIFSMRMQRLCAIIRSNSLGLPPLDSYVNKFYIYRWNLLLQSFEEDLISIWQVKLVNESNHDFFNYVVTNTSKTPIVDDVDAKNIVNVKSLPLSATSAVIKMILLRVENANTKNMTVLLYGCKGYFRICGILNSKENYFEKVLAKPTKHTHPRLTAKIQKVYNIWYGLKKAKQAENNAKYQQEQAILPPKQEAKIENGEVTQRKPVPSLAALENKTDKVSEKPEPSKYKWFLFNISNDFSDIFIKQWKNYLPYNVIMDAIAKAKASERTIRILGPLNSAKDTPKIFALPKAPLNFKKGENFNMTGNFLLFGPYLRDSNSNLLLMQNTNGQMLLRDDFEKKHNIQRETRTRCLWIYANSLRCVADRNIESVQPIWPKGPSQENNLDDQKSLKLRASDDKLKISSVVGGFKKVL